MAPLARAWRDPDKRRALLLSVVVHMAALLLVAVFVTTPRAHKLDQYVVVTFGTPTQSQTETKAAAAESAAPQAAAPQVKSSTIGEPQARSAPKTQAQAPESQPQTVQPPAPALPAPAPQPKPAPKPAPAPPPPPQTAAQAPTPSVQAPAPGASPPVKAPAATTATTLPEINSVEVPPEQITPSITIPKPQAQVELPQTTTLAIAPQARVAAPEKLANPGAQAQVTPARSVPQPQTSVSVARPVAAPQATAQVTPARPLQTPSAAVRVAAPEALQAPAASVQVAAPRQLAAPQAAAQVAPAQPLAAPQATATAGTARDVTIAPQVAVASPRLVPVPSVQAVVTAPTPAAGAPATAGAPAGNTDVATNVTGTRTPGGNAPRAGQVGGNVEAAAAGRGAAAGPGGAATGTGAPSPSPAPFRETLERPLAVLVDNVHGYPQAGLKQASTIIEMPVEGGLTRLMLVYDTADPGKVGPIRSARDYFVTLSQSMDAVLVHDGGSPGAMIAIKRASVPTLDALHRNDLFVRGQARSAPYNLYSEGGALRRAVNRLLPPRTRVLTGTLYRPPHDAPTVMSVTDRFGKTYKTGFRYFPKLDSYRWVRNGVAADDASGENVLVDAVVLAKIDATPLPDDPEGRLYIPLKGGPATLYLHGQAVAGHWQLKNGIEFFTAAGQPVDLAPFRTWIVMTPTYDQRVEQ